MSIQISYELTADQAFHGVRRARRRRLATVRAVSALAAVGGVVLLAVGSWPAGAPALVAGVLLVFGESFVTRLGAARYLAENPGPLTVTFADSGCAFTTDRGRQAFAWSRYRRLAEDDEYLYLYAHREVPVAIPKAAFHPAYLAELTTMLRDRPNYR